MQTWQQLYSPLGNLGLSALAAVIPLITLAQAYWLTGMLVH